MEILDIYDSNRMPTGRTFVRGTKPEGGYYLVAQVIVFNTKGQMLIQQRQAHKLGWPNRWDVSAGGSVQAGETSQQAAQRVSQSVQAGAARPTESAAMGMGSGRIALDPRNIDRKTREEINRRVRAGELISF